MIAHLSLYNRSAVVWSPILCFVACCATLVVLAGRGSFREAAAAAFYFGLKRGFLLVAAFGLIVGILDWFFPKKRGLLIFSAIAASFFSVFVGWVLAQSIIHF